MQSQGCRSNACLNVIPQNVVLRHRRRDVSRKAVVEVDGGNFEQEVLKADTPVLVDFWATWCGPCKLISPIMDQLDTEFGGKLKIVKVNTEANEAIKDKYKVYGLPTLMVFEDGLVVQGSKREGAIGKPAIVDYLAQFGIKP